jgi:hypothetical protein
LFVPCHYARLRALRFIHRNICAPQKKIYGVLARSVCGFTNRDIERNLDTINQEGIRERGSQRKCDIATFVAFDERSKFIST